MLGLTETAIFCLPAVQIAKAGLEEIHEVGVHHSREGLDLLKRERDGVLRVTFKIAELLIRYDTTKTMEELSLCAVNSRT